MIENPYCSLYYEYEPGAAIWMKSCQSQRHNTAIEIFIYTLAQIRIIPLTITEYINSLTTYT